MSVPFTLVRPEEVREALRDLAAEALKAADRGTAGNFRPVSH